MKGEDFLRELDTRIDKLSSVFGGGVAPATTKEPPKEVPETERPVLLGELEERVTGIIQKKVQESEAANPPRAKFLGIF